MRRLTKEFTSCEYCEDVDCTGYKNSCMHRKVYEKLAHYEDLEEQGYKMVNINKIVEQLEDVSCYIEDGDGHAGHLVFTDEAIEIVKEGAE